MKHEIQVPKFGTLYLMLNSATDAYVTTEADGDYSAKPRVFRTVRVFGVDYTVSAHLEYKTAWQRVTPDSEPRQVERWYLAHLTVGRPGVPGDASTQKAYSLIWKLVASLVGEWAAEHGAALSDAQKRSLIEAAERLEEKAAELDKDAADKRAEAKTLRAKAGEVPAEIKQAAPPVAAPKFLTEQVPAQKMTDSGSGSGK